MISGTSHQLCDTSEVSHVCEDLEDFGSGTDRKVIDDVTGGLFGLGLD